MGSRMPKTIIALLACLSAVPAISAAADSPTPETGAKSQTVKAQLLVDIDGSAPARAQCLQGIAVVQAWNDANRKYDSVVFKASTDTEKSAASIDADNGLLTFSSAESTFAFEFMPSSAQIAKTLAIQLVKKYRRVAVIADDDERSAASAAQFQQYLRPFGGSVPVESSVPQFAEAPARFAEELKKARIDAVVVFMEGPELVSVLAQVRAEADPLPLFTTHAILDEEAVASGGELAIEGVKFVAPSDSIERFSANSRKQFSDSTPTLTGYFCYVAWLSLYQSAEKFHVKSSAELQAAVEKLGGVALLDAPLSVEKVNADLHSVQYDLGLHTFRKGKVWPLTTLQTPLR